MVEVIKRYAFVDILKGIAILFIVYGHIIPGIFPSFAKWITTFHIPLFFFVSGLLFNEIKYRNNFKTFLIGRGKGLVLPFLIFSLIVAIGYYFLVDDYIKFLITLLSNGWGYALWFVPVLLLVEFAYYPISKLPVRCRVLLLALSVVLSYFSSLKIGLVSNNALLAFCGLWFYGIGNLCRPLLKYTSNPKVNRVIFTLFMGLVISLTYMLFCSVLPEWFVNKIPSPVYYVTPLFAITGMIALSLIIDIYARNVFAVFLSICGKQSLIILAFHQIICMIAQQYVSSKVAILIMIVSLAFLVWFIPVHMPWMLGKKKSE